MSPFQYSAMPTDILRASSEGTWHALETARRSGARFVLASTSRVYGDAGAGRHRENNLDTGMLRIFNTYGPAMRLDDGGVVATFIQQALDGEPLTVTGDGSQTRSLCHVGDTVDAIVRMAMSLHPGPLNVGSPDEISIRDLARLIIDLAGSASQIRFVDRPPTDLQSRRPDISAARLQLGWRPRTHLVDGLKQTLRGIAAARTAGASTLAGAAAS